MRSRRRMIGSEAEKVCRPGTSLFVCCITQALPWTVGLRPCRAEEADGHVKQIVGRNGEAANPYWRLSNFLGNRLNYALAFLPVARQRSFDAVLNHAELIAAVCEAFATERPARFTSNSSIEATYGDDEVDRAEAVFASRTPDTLQSMDVGIGAGSPEVWLNKPARDYFMPGFARLVLQKQGKHGFDLDDFLSILAPDVISAMNQSQKSAVSDVLECIRNRIDEGSAEFVDRRLKRLRS